ncbi:hypothetical protein Mgra_00000898 [Meloidogyne graminicola]|uniref:Plexin domain-containing protein 2 n=1 Tax=Meloidogyne graminicola TaxID=189291 RepID=A0A8T0A2N3_9BILA|nr:hypothetical protein Mgra_00000898 [Meloidogyne graminicola]
MFNILYFTTILILLILPLISSINTLLNYNENWNSEIINDIISHKRVKRGEHDLLDFGSGSTFPPDAEVEDDNNEPETTEHTYYVMTIQPNNEEIFAENYLDIQKWISEGGAVGHTENAHLDNAYRKAAGVKLKFDFPFYGHRLQNLTIATGGFLYLGDQTHSWLAATQYIAPLMANFDTMENGSSISYADDGKRIVVEWKKVTLRDNRPAGPFTFQVHLWRNGNITFVYKEVPIPITNISDSFHPRKMGISDAYLFNHKVTSMTPSLVSTKRVIHEYHRITVPAEKITSYSVVFLQALPTCLNATTCDECQNMQLKNFKCNWCYPKDGGKSGDNLDGNNGGGNSKPFCSDAMGMHRRKQEWIEGNCQVNEENQYCKTEEITSPDNTTNEVSVTAVESQETTLVNAPTIPTTIETNTQVTFDITPSKSPNQHSTDSESSGGVAFFTFFILLVICTSIWVGYAYYNPHTRSGQLLIKYRPSKWQIPSSHVRYSASVHM